MVKKRKTTTDPGNYIILMLFLIMLYLFLKSRGFI